MDKLSEICDVKREHVMRQKGRISAVTLEDIIRSETPEPRGFIRALRDKENSGLTGLIAELKKASPSKGLIRADFSPKLLAEQYRDGGAACLSVLTDIPYFQGSDDYLRLAREAVNLPVLRKDFMIDTYQIIESRALGADCILLIMAALSNAQAAEFEAAAHELGMDVLIEVHDSAEADRALTYLKSDMVGVNNRSLKTLQIDLEISRALSRMIPSDKLKVCESGIFSNDDVKGMKELGYNTFLVGESLMRQDDVRLATETLLGLSN